MGKNHYNEDGSVRVVSDDKRTSWLYEETTFWGDPKGLPVEVADHHEDGTTTAYEYNHSSNPFSDCKGKQKS